MPQLTSTFRQAALGQHMLARRGASEAGLQKSPWESKVTPRHRHLGIAKQR